jgi:Tol biopolymer transport system component
LLLAPARGWSFADNNVRRDRFDWQVVQTEHFDIYYDKKTARMVPRMAHYLEDAWKDVGDMYGYHVPFRTPFFFYSNHNRFEQTNIVQIDEGTGGVTEAFKNRLLIFNDGSQEWLRHVIYHEFTHVVQFNILYGGFWKSVRLLKSPFYPLWMMEGSAEHGSGDIDDATEDMVVRDAVANNQLPDLAELHGFAHLKPNQVTLGYKTGDAAMDFLQQEYGSDKLGKLLFTMKDFFEISSVLEVIIGMDLTRFNLRFHEWMRERYRPLLQTAKPAKFYGTQITQGKDNIPNFNTSPVLSADGKTIYHFSDRDGPDQLYATDIATHKTRALLPLKYRLYENIHTGGRGLSLSPDGRWLAFSGEKEQRDFLYLFDLKKNKLKRVKIPFDEFRTPVFSPFDNNRLVCVGMDNGYNDLYIIDRNGNIVERLTNTPQDERDPVFSADGKKIFYSGEVMSEDLSESRYRNIFSLTLENKFVKEITQTVGSELEPEPIGNDKLVYVRDRDDQENYGFNLCTIDLKTSEEQRLTDFMGGGFSPRYDPKGDRLFFIGFNAGEKHVYQATWTFQNAPVTPPVVEVSSSEVVDMGDGAPRKRLKRAPSLLQWPYSEESPLFLGHAKPYGLQGSTDLFIPFLFYSTLDGLVLVDIWQASDMLGNHQFQEQAQFASRSNTYDLSMIYTYARFRPTVSFGARGSEYYLDFDQDERRRELTAVSFVTYPLDRITSVSLGAGATSRRDSYDSGLFAPEYFNDRFLLTSYDYDTVTGHYLVPTRGQRMSIFYQQGFLVSGGDQLYKSGGFDGTTYVQLPRESTWATRLFYGRSTGRDAQVFRLGGVDRIRALASDSLDNKKTNVTMASTELRFRLAYLNARTKFLFPDFFFKAAYLIVFDDVGYGWDNRAEREAFHPNALQNSAGVGISWPTFILQSYQLNLTVQWAHRTNSGTDIWYITAGPSF